jgi:hypothetical protein
MASSRVIVLNHGDVKSKATVLLRSDSIQFSGRSHNSVGIDFQLECDTAAFYRSKRVEYMYPESMEQGLCGGDDATTTYTLRPKKRGTHVVYTVVNFRGDEESRTKHVIIVK